MRKSVFVFRYVLFLALLIYSQTIQSQSEGLSITGFGEFTYEVAFGNSVDEESAEMYEEYGFFNEYSEERNSLLFPGIALVFTSDMSDEKLAFLTEINFRTENTSVDLGIERCYLRYLFNNQINLSAGIYSAPIGYLNIHQRTHGYLNNSVRPRDMVNLKLGLIPTRIFGLKLDGAFETGSTSSLKYVFSLGSGRNLTPEGSPFEIDIFEENESSLSLSGGLEYAFTLGQTEISLGLSGYTLPKFQSIYIDSLGKEIAVADIDELLKGDNDEGEIDAQVVEYSESGFAPYIKLSNEKMEFITEFHTSNMKGIEGVVDGNEYSYSGFSSELAYKTQLSGKKFMAYVRYDFIKLPEDGGGPFYGLHESGSELKRYYISDNSAIMVGFNWSIFSFNRIKLEYNYVLDGPQPMHAVLLQTAFTF